MTQATSRFARAFWLEAKERGRIREQALPALAPDTAEVETVFSAVSLGTESLVWSGRVPASEATRMRCPFQEGDFTFPLKYGYSNVGRVVAGPSELVGRMVFCLYPHQDRYVAPLDALVPVPDDVPPERAVLAANLETALNAQWDARLQPGDRVSVVGAGVVGGLCAYLASRIPGVEVELVDVAPAKRGLADALSVRFAEPSQARGERDVVFHASGRPAGLSTALELASSEGTIVELSWFGDREVTLRLGERFHSGRLTLRSSQVGSVSPHARPRFQHRSRLELALGLCRDPTLDALIDGESAFEALPELVGSLAKEEPRPLCRRLRY